MSPQASRAAALAPVEEHLRYSGAARAAQIRAAAQREAAEIIGDARQRADAVIAQARAAGRAEAAPLAEAELSQARGRARSALLRVQRDAFDELRSLVRAGVAGLPRQAGYDRVAARIARIAALAAGPGATVTSVPAGGVVARSAGVVVDCSLQRLADRAVQALGADVRELWTP
jgi:vacuolar-type H+-ATPase subunit E/Vma4